MSSDVIGLLPMGGRGTRLGLPFPKPLVPTITAQGIVPIYKHMLGHIAAVSSKVYGIVSSTSCECLLQSMDQEGVKPIMTTEPNLPAALGQVGGLLAERYGQDTLLAVGLPDSIWHLKNGKTMHDVVAAVRKDGALALFMAGSDELDEVRVVGERVVSVITKPPHPGQGMVQGWGAFVVRAGALAGFTDRQKDGPQLGQLDMGWAFLGNSVDLGTPERYIRWHDMRAWNE